MLLAPAIVSVPVWPWARFEHAQFPVTTTHKAILEAARSWRRINGSLALLGPTGAGKTASAVALAHRIIDACLARKRSDADMRFAVGLRFISAKDLAQARREHKLGAGDSPLEAMAIAATLLILDELGYEPQIDTTISDVVDARYRAGLPIVVTSGLSEAELAVRYGDAVKRRLCERGRVVSAF